MKPAASRRPVASPPRSRSASCRHWKPTRCSDLLGSLRSPALRAPGHRPAAKTHHPDRALNFFAYQPNGHRHQPEIESALARFNSKKFPLELQVHSAPLVRGIYATDFFPTDRSIDLPEIYRRRYQEESFVRVQEQPPQLIDVIGTPRATVSVSVRSEQATVFVAIDNLAQGRGLAGHPVYEPCFSIYPKRRGCLGPSGCFRREPMQALQVIKLGGASLGENLPQIASVLTATGSPRVIVHGGGPQVSAMASRLGIPTRKVAGPADHG